MVEKFSNQMLATERHKENEIANSIQYSLTHYMDIVNR